MYPKGSDWPWRSSSCILQDSGCRALGVIHAFQSMHTPHFVFLTQRNEQGNTHQVAPLYFFITVGTGRYQMGSPYVW